MPLKRNHEVVVGEFAILPLIDVMMTALVFAMVAGNNDPHRALEFEGASHQAPTGSRAGSAPLHREPIRIKVDAAGEMLMDGAPASISQIRSRLKSEVQKNPARTVLAQVDRRASVQSFVDLKTVCSEVGLRKVQLDIRENSKK